MKIKRLTALVFAFALAAGAAGVPAVKDVFGIDAAISANADSDVVPTVFDIPDRTIKQKGTLEFDISLLIPGTTAMDVAAVSVYVDDPSVVAYRIDGTKIVFEGIGIGTTKVMVESPSPDYIFSAFNISVISDAPHTVTLGDLDNSGDIDVEDIMLMQKIVASWNIDKSTYNEEAADVNADGNIDLEDLILLQKKVAGWNVTFGK